MLYAKDPAPVTCNTKEFWFDDLGVLHLKYFSKKHKVLRDYIFTSDNSNIKSLHEVKNEMEERMELRRKKRRLGTVALACGLVLLVNITVCVLYLLSH